MGAARLNLVDQEFESLVVKNLERVEKKHGTIWRCKCKCGNQHIVRGSHLTSGQVTMCTDCSHRSRRNPNGVGDMSIHYWNQVLRGAARRNLSVEITKEEAYGIFLDQKSRCALTGVPLCFPPRTNRPDLGNASLDRKSSAQGYVLGNVQWVHKVVNRMKMDSNETEFIDWCGKVAQYKGSGHEHHPKTRSEEVDQSAILVG